MECAICFESLESGAYSTICGHVFCRCIRTVIKRKLMEDLSLSFSKVDSAQVTIVNSNKELNKNVVELKKEIVTLEDKVKKSEDALLSANKSQVDKGRSSVEMGPLEIDDSEIWPEHVRLTPDDKLEMASFEIDDSEFIPGYVTPEDDSELPEPIPDHFTLFPDYVDPDFECLPYHERLFLGLGIWTPEDLDYDFGFLPEDDRLMPEDLDDDFGFLPEDDRLMPEDLDDDFLPDHFGLDPDDFNYDE